MGPLTLITATPTASTVVNNIWSHATQVIIAILGSSVAAGLVSTALGNLRSNATARREHYAEAVRTLVAWNEYPFRIRRRVDDNAETLNKLAALGHDLQERLGFNRAWIAGESAVLRTIYDSCIAELNKTVGPACRNAWQSKPVNSAAEMNLSDFSISVSADIISKMERAVAYRFGWRRAFPLRLVVKRWFVPNP